MKNQLGYFGMNDVSAKVSFSFFVSNEKIFCPYIGEIENKKYPIIQTNGVLLPKQPGRVSVSHLSSLDRHPIIGSKRTEAKMRSKIFVLTKKKTRTCFRLPDYLRMEYKSQ
ncbi:hypothetical protein [Algoriphagus jejuensis]|uniref:hypothetical protein n=1 Tax=Algoriphagus jejuensis TaxID=419934 RepID=UPI0031D0767B